MEIVFKINNKEKARYLLKNELIGDRELTKKRIAIENNCNINDINIYKQKKILFDVTLYKNKKTCEYKRITYDKCISLINECLIFGYKLKIVTDRKEKYTINNIYNDSLIINKFIGKYKPKKI